MCPDPDILALQGQDFVEAVRVALQVLGGKRVPLHTQALEDALEQLRRLGPKPVSVQQQGITSGPATPKPAGRGSSSSSLMQWKGSASESRLLATLGVGLAELAQRAKVKMHTAA